MVNYFKMKPRAILTLGNFFGVAHFYLIIFIITPFLATFMPASETGFAVSLGAIVTLFLFPLMPKLLRRYGARHLAIYFGLGQLVILGLLALGPTSLPAFFLVALACATSPLIAYQMDLLLEATVAAETVTGRVRSLFLTAGNVALIFSPLVAGLILDSTEAYWRVFALAAATLVPFVVLMSLRPLPHGSNPTIVSLAHAFQRLTKDRDMRSTILAHGTLQFFYHLAPLYIPLYLHTVLHMSWDVLGWVFMIMLLPFTILEYPAGWLADNILGDKELLVGGFALLAAGFAALAFVNIDTPLYIIIIILVMNRSGAALVEAMSEGHFFRRVSKDDDAPVGVFRITRPLAALTAPIIGSGILSVAGYGTLFMLTGILIGVTGITAAFSIKDFR